jgi:hypothetical protein
MPEEIVIRVKRGTRLSVEEVDTVEGGADAHFTTTDEHKLRISVKRVEGSNRVSSRVVDMTMCG